MKTLKIAFYGKGGIGKSTIAANVSALLAKQGFKVLHIGCDPKADSTRLLTEQRIPTILQQLDHLEEPTREDLVFSGKFGVSCVEAGGPVAGCGCAGLGITTAIDELQSLGIFDNRWDVIVYDVLGDVVCGGFSVPMRQHYVDRVYIVTSPNYMALYAANNILHGVCRYSNMNFNLCGGIIANHINCGEDVELINRYAKAVKVPVVLKLEDDKYLQLADFRRDLFALDSSTNGENKQNIKNFVENLLNKRDSYMPVPLDLCAMETFGQDIVRSIYERKNFC